MLISFHTCRLGSGLTNPVFRIVMQLHQILTQPLKKRGVYMAKASDVVKIVYDMAHPLAEDAGCTVYDVEFKKEGAEYVLRVTLDSLDDESSVSIEMCEKVSRALSDLLDKNDPTEIPYMLEVSSPGIDRPLKKEEDFQRFKGRDIEIGLYKQLNGTKLILGKLIELKDGVIFIDDGKEVLSVKRDDASFVRLAIIF